MKVDTSKIQGYQDMTPEEKLAALEGFEFEEHRDEEYKKLRDALTKANSEAAEYKKQLRAKLTDDEAKAAKEAEERESMQKELEALKRDKAVGSFKSAYLELGYDAEMASANAEALHSGDFATVFKNQKAFIENVRKTAAAGALDKQPGLSSGEPATSAEDAAMKAFRKGAGV